MEIGVFSYYFFLFLLALVSIFLLKQRRDSQTKPNLPPGSLGIPFLGETLQLYTQNPNVFFSTRQTRYGEVFKTRILGCPSVMLTCPEAAKFVLMTHANLFKPTYPSGKELLIGRSAIFFHQGRYHSQMRKLVESSLTVDRIRTLVPDIEAIAKSTLESMTGHPYVNTFHEMKKFTFAVAVLSIFSQLDTCYKEELQKNFFTVDRGYNSFPINLPGTPYSRSVSARGRLREIISEVISERKAKRSDERNLVDHLLNFEDEMGKTLTDDEIFDNIIGVLFAAQDTTASVLTWIVKYIHDDPQLLDAIKVEQKEVYESNDGGNRPLTWAQTRNMPLTRRVILESLRLSSIISFPFREAVEDVEYSGHLIPKGWKVLPLFRNIHHNPEFYADPYNFDPSRFEVIPKSSKFLPFGHGEHACPGNEVAKLEMYVMIHHLVNNFSWKVVGKKTGVEHDPFPIPPQGLRAKFWKQQ